MITPQEARNKAYSVYDRDKISRVMAEIELSSNSGLLECDLSDYYMEDAEADFLRRAGYKVSHDRLLKRWTISWEESE